MDNKIVSVLVVFALSQVVTCDNVIISNEDVTKPHSLDDVKKYVTGIITELTDTYDIRIKALETKVQNLQRKSDVQGKIINNLELENELLQKSLTTLEPQVRDGVNNTVVKIATKSNINTDVHRKGSSSRVRRADIKHRIAFYAYKSTPSAHLAEDQSIVFDHVTTNIGDAYNVNDGVFVAPAAGVYVFGVTLGHYRTFVQSDNGDGNLVVNGVIVAGLFMSDDQSSQMVVLNLKVGDNVAVLNRDADEGIDGKAYSSFSGFLLYGGDHI